MSMRIDPISKGRVVYFNEAQSAQGAPPAVVLIRPNETPMSDFFSGKFWENLGVLTIASHLEAAGVYFGVLEASLFQCTPEQTVELALERQPRLVGISVFSTDLLDTCLDLAQRLKDRAPEVEIVLGGHGASFVHREILERNPAVAAVIRGEGEHALLELIERPGAERAEIANLTYRQNGQIAVTPAAKVNQDLDRVPLPHQFARRMIADDEVLSKTPLMIVSSRGCFDRCSFCTVTKFYNGSWRGRSPVHVVDELEDMVETFGRTSIHFWDDTFLGPGNVGRRRAIEIAEEILRRNLELTFHITTRPSDLRDDVVAALAEAGLRSVFLGVESSEQSTLDYFDKHAKVEHSETAIDMLWRHGVHRILIGFILFHPQTTWQSFRRDLEYLDKFPYVEMMRISSRLAFHPGSKFWLENREALGPDAYKKSYIPPLGSPELEKLARICNRLYMHTSGIESVIICLEEQYLHDLDAIDLLAGCRTRLFKRLSIAAREISRELEAGRDTKDLVRRSCDEVFAETMSTLAIIEQRLGDDYFDLLKSAYQLRNYEQFLEPAAGGSALL